MTVFKIMGLLLILLSCTYFGIYKSNTLLKRSRSLVNICIGFDKLSVFIKNGMGDLENLIYKSFDGTVKIEDSKPILSEEGLSKEDIELFNKFYGEMGISDREREYKRVMLYKTLFQKQQKAAEENSKRLCKLYNSLGVLSGIAICIFLI